jgi:hypothetical protein
MTTDMLAAVHMQMDAADWFLMALGLLVFAALLLWIGSTLAEKRHTGGEPPSEEDSALCTCWTVDWLAARSPSSSAKRAAG